MHFYANDPGCTVLTAMLGAAGHTLRTIDPDGPCAKAARSVGARVHGRVPTLWEPALRLAEQFGGIGPSAAAEAIAVLGDHGDDPVAVIISEHDMSRYSVPVFHPDQMSEVMRYVAQ